MRDIEIEDFLRSEGFEEPDALARARAALEGRGLTREGKRRIARDKLAAARGLLASTFVRVCGHADCATLASSQDGAAREAVRVARGSCEVCEGSNNRRAAALLARCLAANGVQRMLVVGGTAGQHAEIRRLLERRGMKLRFVDGASGSHSRRDAAPDLDWAQLLVVWGATPLPHKVSKLYTDDPPRHLRVVALAKRGMEALCHEVLRSFG